MAGATAIITVSSLPHRHQHLFLGLRRSTSQNSTSKLVVTNVIRLSDTKRISFLTISNKKTMFYQYSPSPTNINQLIYLLLHEAGEASYTGALATSVYLLHTTAM